MERYKKVFQRKGAESTGIRDNLCPGIKKAAGDGENGRTYDRADTKAGGQNVTDLYLSAGTEVVESGD